MNGATGRRRRFSRLLIGLAVTVLLASCGQAMTGSSHSESAHDATHVHAAENGDLRERTASLSDLPGFLDDQSEPVRLAYRAAAVVRGTLQWIPCYCGCGDSAGHRSNLDCFIHEVKSDGSVVWDDHGTRCGVCVDIALVSAQMKSEGRPDAEIREAIDAAYRNGYAAPTDTSFPPQA